jgi:hypothetical protein
MEDKFSHTELMCLKKKVEATSFYLYMSSASFLIPNESFL